jgi:Zn-dependent M28 family amino/carboxypeptidase
MKASRTTLAAALLAAVFSAPSAPAVSAGVPSSNRLQHAVTPERVLDHLERFQRIATRNGGNRAAGTPGYDRSVDYVVNRLVRAGYGVFVQPFEALFFEENTPPEFSRVTPNPETYEEGTDFFTMTYSASTEAGEEQGELYLAGNIDIPPGPNPSDSSSGCDPADFSAGDPTGKIALIQRGTCDFAVKVQNAADAGAIAAIIFNEGQPGRTDVINGTLGEESEIPAVGTTHALGLELYNLAQSGPVTVRLVIDATTTPIQTANVLAELRGRVRDQDVVVGAHLDSVPEGAGINDNGSGSATILTIAEQMKRLRIRPRNTVRFAFWGAEEGGLFGSDFYVANLTDQQFERIALNLNFDMVGSENFVRFVYDGDGSAFGTAGPPGSDVIERVFNRHFQRNRLATDPTEFDGRSDYFAFINAGIPAGGLFSGAEGVKTRRQARIYGGTAGLAYDPCYHQPCDNIFNVSRRALSQFSDAAAHAVFHFAMTDEDLTPAAAATQQRLASTAAARAAEYRGPYLVR